MQRGFKSVLLGAALAATLLTGAASAADTLNLPTSFTDGQIIDIPAGTYEPIDLSLVTQSVTLRANGPVVLDGGGVRRCATLGASVTLDGFTLRNGKADAGGGAHGGTLVGCTVENCEASLGGGTYNVTAKRVTYRNNRATFLGNAAFGGWAFSCLYADNTSAAPSTTRDETGIGALCGVRGANLTVLANTARTVCAGAVASDLANTILCDNRANRNSTAPDAADAAVPVSASLGLLNGNVFGPAPASSLVQPDAALFADAAGHISDAGKALVQDRGDAALGGDDSFDRLTHPTDLDGRTRVINNRIDIGAYEIPQGDLFTVAVTVRGVGSVTSSADRIYNGDPVTLTAQPDAAQPRDFLGFWVNGSFAGAHTRLTVALTASDTVEARFAGLSATPDTLAARLAEIQPDEELTLAAGAYTLPTLTQRNVFIGADAAHPESVVVSAAGDAQESTFVGLTLRGTVARATAHRSILNALTGSGLTLTSCLVTDGCAFSACGAAVNVTSPTALIGFASQTDCLVRTTGGDPLAKGDAAIDAGTGASGVTPYDALDLRGRPRVLGAAIDRGANECDWITVTVAKSGHGTVAPAVGVHDVLAYDALTLTATETGRAFLGWTLPAHTVEPAATLTVTPEADCAFTATFAPVTAAPGADGFPSGTTAEDTIVLAAGTYDWAITTPGTVVGTGDQAAVVLTGTISGGTFEAVTFSGATIQNATLRRCRISDGTTASGVTAYSSIFVDSTVSGGRLVNATLDNTSVADAATVDCLTARRGDAIFTDDYRLAESATAHIDCVAAPDPALGALDYYGNLRRNGVAADRGAAEYQWPPYRVTVNVSGHGAVAPRGDIAVVRGDTLALTVRADRAHPRELVSVTVDGVAAQPVNGVLELTPAADQTVDIVFAGLTVKSPNGADAAGDFQTIQDALDEAQDGETIRVWPGVYGAVNALGERTLTLVAVCPNPARTVIDGGGRARAATLGNAGSRTVTLDGFTIRNGYALEGAGVLGGIVRRSIITGNRVTYNGTGAGVNGALAVNCLIVGNGDADLARSTGGGAYESELLNCTVVDNIATKGAGLYECHAKNSILMRNAMPDGTEENWYGEESGDPENCCSPGGTGDGAIAADPSAVFVDAAHGDWRLRADAPCRDAGATDERLGDTDLLGHARQFGGAVDCGAIEWNNPPFFVTVEMHGRATATFGDLGTIRATDGAITFAVPRNESAPGSIAISVSTETDHPRTFKGVQVVGGAFLTPAGNGVVNWPVAAADTVNVRLLVQVEDLTATTETIETVLASAVSGERVNLADGTYTQSLTVKPGVTVLGSGNVVLAGGVTGGGTVRNCVLAGHTGGAAADGVTLLQCLVRDNAGDGLRDGVAVLSTIVNNEGIGLAGASAAFGCVVWHNYGGDKAATATATDSVIGGAPAFAMPAPEGSDYRPVARAAMIDLAGDARWPALGVDWTPPATDLDGRARNALDGYDAGAYEYTPTVPAAPGVWSWYGVSDKADGRFGDAAWVRSIYDPPRLLPTGANAQFADRPTFASAAIEVMGTPTVGTLTFNSDRTAYTLVGSGRLAADAVRVTAKAPVHFASDLSLAEAFTVAGNAVTTFLDAGTVRAESVALSGGARLSVQPDARLDLRGKVGFASDADTLVVDGGAVAISAINSVRGTLVQNGGTFSANYITLMDEFIANGTSDTIGDYRKKNFQSCLVFNGGTARINTVNLAACFGIVTSGNTVSRTMMRVTGGDVTIGRMEVGCNPPRMCGDILQTGGTVTLTSSDSPLVILSTYVFRSGSSTYTLAGGTLRVPNGTVSLPTDRSKLNLTGGLADIKNYSGNGVTLAGGTLRLAASPSGTLKTSGGVLEAAAAITVPVQFVSGTTTLIAERGKLTINPASGSTGAAVFARGAFGLGNTNLSGDITLGAGVTLDPPGAGLTLASGKTLTLPGDGAATVNGAVTLADGATVAIAPVIPATADFPVVVLRAASIPEGLTVPGYTLAKQTAADGKQELVVTASTLSGSTGGGTTEETTVPTLTLAGDATWTGGAWSSPFVASGPALVNVTDDAVLTMNTNVSAGELTLNIPEGKTLTIGGDAGKVFAMTKLNICGGGTLCLTMSLWPTELGAIDGTVTVGPASAAGEPSFGAVWNPLGTIRATDGASLTLTDCALNMTAENDATLTLRTASTWANKFVAGGNLDLILPPGRTLTGVLDVNGDLTVNGNSGSSTHTGLLRVNGAITITSGTFTATGDVTFGPDVALDGTASSLLGAAFRSLRIESGATINLTAGQRLRTTAGDAILGARVGFVVDVSGRDLTTPQTVTLVEASRTLLLTDVGTITARVTGNSQPVSATLNRVGEKLTLTLAACNELWWSGGSGNHNDWHGTGNWHGQTFTDGVVAKFAASGEAVLSRDAAPASISVTAAVNNPGLTLVGDGGAFIGTTPVEQAGGSSVVWQDLFISAGTYMLADGATARGVFSAPVISSARLTGGGAFTLATGSALTLRADAPSFTGSITLENGAALTLASVSALPGATISGNGALTVPATGTVTFNGATRVAQLILAGDTFVEGGLSFANGIEADALSIGGAALGQVITALQADGDVRILDGWTSDKAPQMDAAVANAIAAAGLAGDWAFVCSGGGLSLQRARRTMFWNGAASGNAGARLSDSSWRQDGGTTDETLSVNDTAIVEVDFGDSLTLGGTVTCHELRMMGPGNLTLTGNVRGTTVIKGGYLMLPAASGTFDAITAGWEGMLVLSGAAAKVGLIDVAMLQLDGNQIPAVAAGSVRCDLLWLSDARRNALFAALSSEPIVIIENWSGTTVPAIYGAPSNWRFSIVNGSLVLAAADCAPTQLKATISRDGNWSDLVWKENRGTTDAPVWETVNGTIDWSGVESVTFEATAEATLAVGGSMGAVKTLVIAGSAVSPNLTLSGVTPFPSLSTLQVNGSLELTSGALTVLPNLTGGGRLTLHGGVTSTRSGSSNQFAFNGFTGTLVMATDSQLTLRGGGGATGLLPTTLTVGGTLNLNAANAFGWGKRNQTVVRVAGGRLNTGTNQQLLRRTFELADGAVFNVQSAQTFCSCGGRIHLVAGGCNTASVTGNDMGFFCDSNCNNNRTFIYSAAPGTTLTVDTGVRAGNANANDDGFTFSGGGTIVMNGDIAYSTKLKTADTGTTLILNGTVSNAKNTTVATGTRLGGAGEIAFVSGQSLTFASGAQLRLVPDGVLTVRGTFSGTLAVADADDELGARRVVLASTINRGSGCLEKRDGFTRFCDYNPETQVYEYGYEKAKNYDYARWAGAPGSRLTDAVWILSVDGVESTTPTALPDEVYPPLIFGAGTHTVCVDSTISLANAIRVCAGAEVILTTSGTAAGRLNTVSLHVEAGGRLLIGGNCTCWLYTVDGVTAQAITIEGFVGANSDAVASAQFYGDVNFAAGAGICTRGKPLKISGNALVATRLAVDVDFATAQSPIQVLCVPRYSAYTPSYITLSAATLEEPSNPDWYVAYENEITNPSMGIGYQWLSYKKNRSASLCARLNGGTVAWSAIPWTTTDGEPLTAAEIDWSQVNSITITASTPSAVTVSSVITLANQTTLTLGSGVTLTNTGTISGGSLVIEEGATVSTKITSNNVFTLQMAVRVDGRLIILNGGNIQQESLDYSRIIGTGVIEYTGTGWTTLPNILFSETLSLANNLANGIVVPKSYTGDIRFRNLSGTGYFRSDWTGTGPRAFQITQTRDSTFSGRFTQNDNNTRRFCVTVSGEKPLTVDGADNTVSTLDINGAMLLDKGARWTVANKTTIRGTIGVCATSTVASNHIAGPTEFIAGSKLRVAATNKPLVVNGAVSGALAVELTDDVRASDVESFDVLMMLSGSTLSADNVTAPAGYSASVVTRGNFKYLTLTRDAFAVVITEPDEEQGTYSAAAKEAIAALVTEKLSASGATPSGQFTVSAVEVTANGVQLGGADAVSRANDALACFTGVAEVVRDAGAASGKIVIAYDFGVRAMSLATGSVTATVSNAAQTAAFADGVTFTLHVSDTVNGTAADHILTPTVSGGTAVLDLAPFLPPHTTAPHRFFRLTVKR